MSTHQPSVRYHRIAVDGYDISFNVLSNTGVHIGSLTLAPHGLNIEFPGGWRGCLVECKFAFSHYQYSINAGGVLTVGGLIDLLDVLLQFQNHRPVSLALGTIGPGFDLELGWCKLGGDVVFRCQLSSGYGEEREKAVDGSIIRDLIRERHSFEFWQDPVALAAPIQRLTELLAYLQRFNPDVPSEHQGI